MPKSAPLPSSGANFLVMRRREPLSSFGATSLEHQASVFGGHAGAEAMRLGAAPVVRLKSAFRHSDEFLSKTKRVRLIAATVYCQETGRVGGV